MNRRLGWRGVLRSEWTAAGGRQRTSPCGSRSPSVWSSSRSAAGARAIAAGPEPAAVRHARLRTLLGAGLLRDAEAARTVGELARDLRNTLRPAAADVHLFFRGTDARVFVPEVLGELSHLLHLRWSDPCAR